MSPTPQDIDVNGWIRSNDPVTALVSEYSGNLHGVPPKWVEGSSPGVLTNLFGATGIRRSERGYGQSY